MDIEKIARGRVEFGEFQPDLRSALRPYGHKISQVMRIRAGCGAEVFEIAGASCKCLRRGGAVRLGCRAARRLRSSVNQTIIIEPVPKFAWIPLSSRAWIEMPVPLGVYTIWKTIWVLWPCTGAEVQGGAVGPQATGDALYQSG